MTGDEHAAPQDRPSARHRLSRDHFDAMAGGRGGADTVSQLLAAERSWRLIQLRAVLDAVGSQPDATGQLPPVERAWGLLVQAQRQAPSEVDKILLHPQAGTWAGYALRRLRGSTRAEAPLWVDIGYLHALAAAAAVRAGLSFDMTVPVRDGFVVLPTLGGGHLPPDGRWGFAEVRGAGGTVTVTAAGATLKVPAAEQPGADVDGWVPLPVVRAQSAGHTLSVTLDYIDPYRNLRAPTPPDRLSADQLQRWQTLLAQAWGLIVAACPELAPAIARGLSSVVPQPAAERFRTMSASAGDAFGSTIVSEPEDAPELAVTLVHEFQHIKLGGLLHLTTLHHAEPAQRLYAPWRDDPRPLGGLLQGVYAFVGITEFWRAFRHQATGRTARLAHFEFARWRHQVRAVLRMLAGLPELTEVGRRLVAGLDATAAGWPDEEVPAELRAAGEAAAADHRARWRLHHLRPDPQQVSGYAAAWAAGTGPPGHDHPDPEVAADQSARRLDTRAVLALWRLTDPDGFARLEKDPPTVGTHVSGATPADIAYTAGDLDLARQLYLAELATDPDSPSAWAGLGLVESALRAGPAADALRERPELVRAVHREVSTAASGAGQADGTGVDPLAVAGWIGGAALR